jgi:hAT family C-terminal dimerisation region
MFGPFLTAYSVLNPRISYQGVLQDYADDPELLKYLDSAKLSLHAHYNEHYVNCAHSFDKAASTTVPSAMDDSPSKVNFTLRYKKKDHQVCDELGEYFKLPGEDFNTCKPLQWWVGRQAQFPNLYCFAQDLITIPGVSFSHVHNFECSSCFSQGSAVNIERIFSGGCDTISLRRASLQPETIRMLMLVKQHLRLSCVAVDKVL